MPAKTLLSYLPYLVIGIWLTFSYVSWSGQTSYRAHLQEEKKQARRAKVKINLGPTKKRISKGELNTKTTIGKAPVKSPKLGPTTPIISITSKPQPVRELKSRKYHGAGLERITWEDTLQLSRQAAKKKCAMTSMELSHLKKYARERNLDDWLSQIDSSLSYGENRANLEAQFGRVESDDDLSAKFQNFMEQRENYKEW